VEQPGQKAGGRLSWVRMATQEGATRRRQVRWGGSTRSDRCWVSTGFCCFDSRWRCDANLAASTRTNKNQPGREGDAHADADEESAGTCWWCTCVRVSGSTSALGGLADDVDGNCLVCVGRKLSLLLLDVGTWDQTRSCPNLEGLAAEGH
jgi:hypothetical protein